MRLIAAGLLLLVPSQSENPPLWVGIASSPAGDAPAVEGRAWPAALRVDDVTPGGPAEKGGLRRGDWIVSIDGRDLPAEERLRALREAITSKKAGAILELGIVRDGIEGLPAGPVEAHVREKGELTLRRRISRIDLRVVLEPRPSGIGGSKTIPERSGPARPVCAEETLAMTLGKQKGLDASIADLRQRLAGLHRSADRFRLARCAQVHRDPFQAPAITSVERLDPASAADWLDVDVAACAPMKTGLSWDAHLAQLTARLQEVRRLRDRAFAGLDAAEQAFIDANLDGLAGRFAEELYLESDPDRERWSRHARVLALAARVDFGALFQAAAELWAVADPDYLEEFRFALEGEWERRGRPGGVFIEEETAIGRLVVAGHERTWHRAEAALIIDLGGDDFYSNRSGLLQIDFSGDDSYEATAAWAQGSGRMGCALLVDVAGDDQYVGDRWAQGSAALGAGLLWDLEGDDTYRGGTFVQAAALWGIGLLRDDAGRDRYEAHHLSQGVGMPGGAGWLADASGDDAYYSKGTKPTGYGDAGIFDSWSQGCGVGFRQHQSGGVGLLWDGSGRDRYEAGNFSQGGGYYYGVGLLRDASGDDRYIGSRYNQGFSAHQAVGIFEDYAGNDRYETRQGVAQGLAWDQSVTWFIDHGGDDSYDGGEFFSQAAVAHNAITVFVDAGGKDRYRYEPGQAKTGGNDYHGGGSLGLFIDAGGGDDDYGDPARNNTVLHVAGDGFACDLPGAIDSGKLPGP